MHKNIMDIKDDWVREKTIKRLWETCQEISEDNAYIRLLEDSQKRWSRYVEGSKC